MNLLNKTKAYLVGAIERDPNGRNWRKDITEKLSKIGIVCFNPYSKPFVVDVDENETIQENLKQLIEQEKYDEVAEKMKLIRIYDLAVTDKADFIIAYINSEIVTVGTWEEIFWANREKKPIFLIFNKSKKTVPLWLFGTIPHKYFYPDVDSAVDMLKKIDSGEKEMDNHRWKLLRSEFR